MRPEIKRDHPKNIQIEEISPSTLASFLRIEEEKLRTLLPSLEVFGQDKSYTQIFIALRTLRLPRQEELLVGFLTQNVENFPNPEKLGRFLAKLNKLVLFQPKRGPSPEKLHRLSDEYFQRLKITPLPVKIIEGSWEEANALIGQAMRDYVLGKVLPYQEAMIKVRDTVREVAKISLRSEAWQTARLLAGQTVWSATEHARLRNIPVSESPRLDLTLAASDFASWCTVEDLMSQHGYTEGNPWEPLFRGIYDQGLWFIGPVEGKSVVFIPPIKNQ